MTINRFTPVSELPQLLRVGEVAAVLGVSKGLVYEMVRRDELHAVKLGRLLRIPREQLTAWATNGNGYVRKKS